MAENGLPDQRFPIALLIVIGVLLAGVVVQTVMLFESSQEIDAEQQDYAVEDADVAVAVGDGYYQQEGDLSEDIVEAEEGDLIYFYNEGDIPHTVTIPSYGFDEFLNPGEEVFVRADAPLEEGLLDCTLHAHHEAIITVR